MYRFTYDDEDRLAQGIYPGATDTFTYNGLGLRAGKTDSTGTYSYICDGTSPGSPVLSDGHALYTPGLSENRNGVSGYYANDRLGNLWTIDGSGKTQTTYGDFSGFGLPIAGSSGASAFGYGGGNGCQTDADTGLILMGHRYYDTRIGRFISQDPAGSGDNWYAYAGNDPVDEVDPSGLAPMDGPGSSPMGTPGYDNIAGAASAGAYYDNEVLTQYNITHSFSTWWRFSANADGGGSYKDTGVLVQGSESWSITGNAFATGYNPTSQMMRTPKWLGKLVGGVGLALQVLGGVHGHIPNVAHVDTTVAEEKEVAEEVKQKQDKKSGGSNFTLQNIENYLKQSGSNARDNLDYLAEVLNRQNRQNPTIFGGAGGAWAWE